MATLTVQGVEDALLEICGSRGANSDQFRKELNLALPRLYNMGMWRDLLFEHVVTTTASTFTIPDNAESIISALVDSDSNSIDYSYPNTVYGPHHDYRIAGRNDRAGDHTLASFGIVDDGYSATVEEPVDGKTYSLRLAPINPATALPSSGIIYVTFSDGTNTSKLGTNEDSADGGKFTCDGSAALNTASVTSDITSISEIRVSTTELSDPVQLLWVETGSSPEVTLVAANDLQQANQVTRYRRYRIDNRNEKTMSIRLLLKRKFQTLLSSTDVVYVSSLSAIKHAMLGNTAEDNADLERANYHWGICRAILDEELDAHRGAAKPRINFDPSGVGAYTNNMM
ncbi:MAG: hypothetical protein CL438_09165 [Acidimicrobiaceae bacterium]|nr:hypothetical protein [Acidimicrobiaceae bacterium]|tara:strand:- start:909 stop:1934 length:1026 start_codon:yes stop_codon:yes gene_type:complete